MTDIVLTAWGAVTGAGDDASFRAAWLEGRSAVRRFEGDDHEGLPPGYGAPLAFSRKELRGLPGGRALRPGTMTAFTEPAVGALGRALLAAGSEDPESDPPETADRRGLYLGSYTNFPELKKHVRLTHVMASPEAAAQGAYVADDERIMEGMKGFTGFDFLKLMNNMPSAHGAIQANARGPVNTFLGLANAGLQAVGKAAVTIRLGLADQVFAGGTGPGCMEGLALVHNAYGVLADPGQEPSVASRPLDAAATGLVPGDAGAVVCLESAASAEAGGRRALASLRAAHDLFTPPLGPRGPLNGAGSIVRLLRALLDQAGWRPEDVDYIGAGATGLPALDRLEAEALAAVFGTDLGGAALGVHAGISGYTEAAHGVLGLVGALQAFEDGRVPPTTNLSEPVGGLEAGVVRTSAEERAVRRAVVLALSPEGGLAGVAVEKA